MFLCHVWVLAQVMCTYWSLLLMTRTTSQVPYSTSIVWSTRIAFDGTFGQVYNCWWQLAKEFLGHHRDAKYYYIYCQHSITWFQYQVKPCQECNKPWFLSLFSTFQFINLCDSFEEEGTLPHLLNRKIKKNLNNIAFSTFYLSVFDYTFATIINSMHKVLSLT